MPICSPISFASGQLPIGETPEFEADDRIGKDRLRASLEDRLEFLTGCAILIS